MKAVLLFSPDMHAHNVFGFLFICFLFLVVVVVVVLFFQKRALTIDICVETGLRFYLFQLTVYKLIF